MSLSSLPVLGLWLINISDDSKTADLPLLEIKPLQIRFLEPAWIPQALSNATRKDIKLETTITYHTPLPGFDTVGHRRHSESCHETCEAHPRPGTRLSDVLLRQQHTRSNRKRLQV